MNDSKFHITMTGRQLGKTFSQTKYLKIKMEEQTFHNICKELVNLKDKLLEIELELDEPLSLERILTLQEQVPNIKQNIKQRLLTLNKDLKSWEIEILKEYGLYSPNA